MKARLRVNEREDSRSRCPYCRDRLDEQVLNCLDCKTPMHQECWNEVDECPTLGCAGFPRQRARVTVKREGGGRNPRRLCPQCGAHANRQSRWDYRRTLLAIGVFIATFGLLLTLTNMYIPDQINDIFGGAFSFALAIISSAALPSKNELYYQCSSCDWSRKASEIQRERTRE